MVAFDRNVPRARMYRVINSASISSIRGRGRRRFSHWPNRSNSRPTLLIVSGAIPRARYSSI